MDLGSSSADNQELAQAGYRQQLSRTLGRFSSFAAGFSYLSILTGVFQFFYLGFGFGGPAFFWTWPTFFLGQFLVALCFAELAGQYPLAGSIYQWSKQVGSRASGWMAGWIYLASYIITIAAVALALQITLPQVASSFQIIGDGAKNAVLLGCFLISITTLINAIGVNWMARINNLGVFSELIGAVILIALFILHARRGPVVVFEMQGRGGNGAFGYVGPFCIAAIMASYVMYGFDTAGSLAEETTEPRKKVPGAILQALSAAALLGAMLLLGGLMAAPDIAAPELSEASGGLPLIVTSTLGEPLGKLFLCDVVFAIFVCALAVQTGTVRLIFAMARDNNLPYSAALARVSGASGVPIVPAVVAGALAILVLIVNINAPRVIVAVGSVAIVWANLAYLLVTVPLLFRRLGSRRWRPIRGTHANEVFSLGRWGLLVNFLAAIWGVLTVVNIGWPRPEIYGEVWYEQYAAILFTSGLVIVGGVYYVLVQRHKSGILPEHRAADKSGISSD